METEKVYCRECIYSSFGNDDCRSLNFVADWYCHNHSLYKTVYHEATPVHREYTTYEPQKCEVLNKNNDCQYFRPPKEEE